MGCHKERLKDTLAKNSSINDRNLQRKKLSKPLDDPIEAIYQRSIISENIIILYLRTCAHFQTLHFLNYLNCNCDHVAQTYEWQPSHVGAGNTENVRTIHRFVISQHAGIIHEWFVFMLLELNIKHF